MSSQAQLSMHEALEAFSQGDIARADTILEAAGQENTARASVDDALSLACMRASIAAMEGASDICQLMAPVSGTPQGLVATRYLEGLAALARNSLETAHVKFSEAQRLDPSFKLANLGLAAVLYLQKHYKSSFSQYREVLSALGSEVCPPIVRVGMGLCAYRLGSLDEAEQILERALEVNADDELALFGLLVVYLERRSMDKVAETVARLRVLLPHNTTVLLKVADLMYFKAQAARRVKASLRQIQQLLREVRRLGTADECGLADYQEGRLLLVSGDLAGAQPLLEAALRTFPTLMAARIHYARLLHHSGKEAEAHQLLRKIDEDHPNQKEVLQLLTIYATRRGEHDAALKYCRLLTETVAQGDLRSWSLAAWCTRLNPAEHEQLLAQVVSIHRELKLTPPWQLLANVATANKDVAALQAVVDRELGGDFVKKSALATEHVPLLFNFALLLEKDDRPRARQLYTFLVKRHGTFALAYLRLHEMARQDGLKKQAVAWLTLLAEVLPAEPNTHAGIAKMFFAERRIEAAMTVLKSSKSKTIPVVLAQGAVYLWCCQSRSGGSQDQLERAKSRFAYVLGEDHENILAAHGLACCLGLQRQYECCQSMLNGVSEVAANSAYVREKLNLNMANVKALSERYKQAIDYYLKVPTRTAQENSLLAFCYACDDRYPESMGALTEAVAASEDEQRALETASGGGGGARKAVATARATTDKLRYNLAVVCCSAFLSRLITKRTLSVDEARELNGILERGLRVATEFLDSSSSTLSSSVRQQSRLYIKSICSYSMRVHETIFRQHLAHGIETSVESEREAERWREVFAASRAEKEREAERQRLEKAASKAEAEELGRKLLARFVERRESDPLSFEDLDINAARIAEMQNTIFDDLMEDRQDLNGGEAAAALTGMDLAGDAGMGFGSTADDFQD